MKLSQFDYLLPDELIADRPASKRDKSKLLVLDRTSKQIAHRHFFDLPEILKPGDLLVLNNTKVFPAKLFGQKAVTGGKVEILLSRELEPGLWEVLGKNLKNGIRIVFPDSPLEATVVGHPEKTFLLRFNISGQQFFMELEKIGRVPLPPYIEAKRSATKDIQVNDKESYQTVYAKEQGSIAAPTAGLHFTPELIEELSNRGIETAEVTLHVGLGTFLPVEVDDIKGHKMHSEYYTVDQKTADTISRAKKENRRIVAVGTTATRVLEHVFSNYGTANALSGWTDIFIYPGYKFKCVDALITNFHLPKSTLLMLVSAFAGYETVMKAYEEAIKNKYRFYSYGDAMLIL